MKLNNDLWLKAYAEAQKAVGYYAQGVVEVQMLAERMVREWEEGCDRNDQSMQQRLLRLAQRLCSCMLCEAWRSRDSDVRNRAFDAIHVYLRRLLQTRYVSFCQRHPDVVDDLLHQTLEELHLVLMRGANAGPDDPAAFLKWMSTILHRKVYAYQQKSGRHLSLSLEQQVEDSVEQWEDERNPDPLKGVLQKELHQALKAAILSLRNPRYKEVLWYSFLLGMDEIELASQLHASVDEIYVWRCRALKALRKNNAVMQELRLLVAG